MKSINLLVSITLAGLLLGNVARAGEVTLPAAYTAGDTLTAQSLNERFNAVKSAVDNNFARTQGVVTVDSHDFQNQDLSVGDQTECVLRRSYTTGYAYYLANPAAANSSCDAVTGIQLAHGRVLSELKCMVRDNSPDNAIDCSLRRVDLLTGIDQIVYATPDTVDSIAIQILSDTTPAVEGREIVDNLNYSYYVVFSNSSTDWTGIASNARFYATQVFY